MFERSQLRGDAKSTLATLKGCIMHGDIYIAARARRAIFAGSILPLEGENKFAPIFANANSPYRK